MTREGQHQRASMHAMMCEYDDLHQPHLFAFVRRCAFMYARLYVLRVYTETIMWMSYVHRMYVLC